MPNQKLPQLPVLNIASGGTLLYVVDISDTTDDPTGSSKQISRDNLLKNLSGLTATTISAATVTVSGTSALNGGITSTSYTGTTSRLVEASSGGTVTASKDIISGYISDSTVITNLTTSANWTINGSYTGTSITGTYQGQNYYDDNYFYTFVADNTPIRLIRG